MPYNGSGTFSLTYDWTTEQASSPIEISKLDEQEVDIAAGLSNCILRDGTGLPTTAIPWNSQNLTGVGTLTAVTGTFSGAVTATSLVPSSSTVPANGLYLPAANTVGLASNTTLRWSVNSTGNHVIAAPSSGTTLALTNASGGSAITSTDGTVSSYLISNGSTLFFGTSSNHPFNIRTNANDRISIASAGNVTIAAPSSGTALAVTGVSGGTSQSWTDGTRGASLTHSASNIDFGATTTDALNLITTNTRRVVVGSAGNVTINAASSGDELTVTGSVVATSFSGALTGDVTGNVSGSSGSCTGNAATATTATTASSCSGNAATATALATPRNINGTAFDGTANITVTAAAGTLTGATLAAGVTASSLTSVAAGCTVGGVEIGFRGIPQNAQTGNYTLVAADAGGHIYHAAAAGAGDTYTIPANGSVAYTIGTAITFINRDTTNSVSIAITTDTLTQAGTGSTGTRTLAAYGVATAIKITSTEWIISGTGLS